MPATAAAPRIPDGYTLIDRLGAGGYGEVWRATAPGGVEKAVKVVFGHCDADLADRERKSLERVRSVRHPFLLTVERYEVVDNRLIIVTELADLSLDQLFRKYRANGKAGVPRDLLLRLLADAAEALDCLSEQHDLQHLDVKPENLLLVGDHAKVADYGLVKQLASRTQQSMVGGMTPLYSAPEVFDGAPTRSSDQYSLAIVFQYMLTGVLPFSGQTVSQLVKQHTMAEPNLGPLGEADRKVVARALSKEGSDRYGSCREFVRALTGAALDPASNVAPAPLPNAPAPTSPDDTKSILAISTQPLRHSEPDGSEGGPAPAESTPPPEIAPRRRRAPLPPGPSEVLDESLPDGFELTKSAQPTLFVGLGGVGAKLLASTKLTWDELGDGVPAAAWLAIDTDRDQLTELRVDTGLSQADGDSLHTPLRRPKDYRNANPSLLRGVARRWLYNIPRSLTTRGFRPLGRVALVDNAERVARAVASKLRHLSDADQAGPVRVVVLAGGCGGAGGGMLIDLAQAIHSVAESASVEVRVEAMLGLPSKLRSSDKLGAASLVSLLIELAHSQAAGNKGPAPVDGWVARYERDQAPFSHVNLYASPAVHDAAYDTGAPGLLATSLFDLEQLAQDDAPDVEGYRVLGAVDLDRVVGATHLRARQSVRAEAARLLSNIDPVAKAQLPTNSPQGDDPAAKKSVDDLRKSFQAFLDGIPHHGCLSEAAIADETALTAERVTSRFLDLALGKKGEGLPLQPERCRRLLDDLVNEETKCVFDENVVAQRVLAAVEVDALGCGYRRQTIVICPREGRPAALLDALKSQRPQLAITEADTPTTLLVCLGRGPIPRFLASRIESVFPDVVDAAKRLQTRSDIEWNEL